VNAGGPTSRGVDEDVPNVARIYDYFLGGNDNFAADRAAAAKIAQTAPEVVQRVRENRDFLGRAVEFLATAGIRQFLDVGTGLPTQNSVHQVARRVVPAARVAYVDYDPAVIGHAQALLAGDQDAIAIEADMREPAVILRRVTEQEVISLDQPVAVLMLAVLHFVPDTAQAAQIVATFRDRMAPGSYLAISHATAGNMNSDDLAQAKQIYASSSAGSITLRTPDEIEALFDGLELQEPGVVPVAYWRPRSRGADPAEADVIQFAAPPQTAVPPATYGPAFLAGLARKPPSPK
jgi:hypothetical protein